MRMVRDIKPLLTYWRECPPPHLALLQVRDVVITALGGKPPSRKADEVETEVMSPEEAAKVLASLRKPEGVARG